ncbi:MAG TPA: hypothetical protein VJT73_03345 [Polyangiaceae bacterium]|nr:hypothetical protein [Polyangiaceae bacterium]
MKQIHHYLASKQIGIASHGFFARLERDQPFESAMAFAPVLTFWVFAFQDILRLNETRVLDPKLRKIARHHRAEDKGHEVWFMNDVAELDPTPRDFRWLFGPGHRETREAAYALMSEVFRADDDQVRIVLLLTLESAGHIFFERIARFVARHDLSERLQYFSHHHLAAEKDHELFEVEMMKALDVELAPTVRAKALAMIDRCYEAFNQLFCALEAGLSQRPSAVSARPSDPSKGERAVSDLGD